MYDTLKSMGLKGVKDIVFNLFYLTGAFMTAFTLTLLHDHLRPHTPAGVA